MTEKKEVQAKILKAQNNGKVTQEEFTNILRLLAPGTHLRTGIDGALKAGKGALIFVKNDNDTGIIEGGFKVNTRFTPQRLIELSKMDGAIVLSKDMKKILHANVLLTPDHKIKSKETGTRHKAGERTAKQTNGLVIAISERRNETTVFYKNKRYILKSTDDILRKANESIQLLEKQRELFDRHINKLGYLEIRNYPSLNQALNVIQKGKIIEKIADELKKQTIELGNEGTLIKTRLKEIAHGIEKELNLVIKDYTKLDLKKSRTLLESLSYDELTDEDNILRVLAHESATGEHKLKGWRILSKTTLPEPDLASIIKESKTLGKAIHSNIKTIEKILDKEKAEKFKDEVEKLKMA